VAAALQPASQKGTPELESAPGVTFRLNGQTHAGQRLHLALDRNHQVRADTLNASALSAGLFALDSLNTSLELAAQLGREGRDSSVWTGLRDDRLNAVRVPLGLWPEQSRLAMLRGNRPATARQLAMFSVGAAENRVTSLDLTEAFARLVTDRRVGLTFVPTTGRVSFPSMALAKYAWYSTFIGGLHDVGTVGTARGTQAAITQQLSPNLQFYGKSGTLNAPPHVRKLQRVDSVMSNGHLVSRRLTFTDTVVPPVVAKTLLFAIGTRYARKAGADSGATGSRMEVGSGGAIDCGVVGTIYFRLRRNPPHVESLATDFANERLWRLLRKNWQRLKVC
jgi:hypothetical protein